MEDEEEELPEALKKKEDEVALGTLELQKEMSETFS